MMDAVKIVTDMYNKLETEYGFTNDITSMQQYDFDGFCVVGCTEQDPVEASVSFDLIVLENGTVLNDSGEDVYKLLSSILSGSLTDGIVFCTNCGADLTQYCAQDSNLTHCPQCGTVL